VVLDAAIICYVPIDLLRAKKIDNYISHVSYNNTKSILHEYKVY